MHSVSPSLETCQEWDALGNNGYTRCRARRRALGLLAVFAILLLPSCQTGLMYPQSRFGFLKTSDTTLEKWLDGRVDVYMINTPMWGLKEVRGIGFEKAPLLLLGRDSQYGVLNIQADNITRRELFWLIHKQLKVYIDITDFRGYHAIRLRSQEYMRLTDPN